MQLCWQKNPCKIVLIDTVSKYSDDLQIESDGVFIRVLGEPGYRQEEVQVAVAVCAGRITVSENLVLSGLDIDPAGMEDALPDPVPPRKFREPLLQWRVLGQAALDHLVI